MEKVAIIKCVKEQEDLRERRVQLEREKARVQEGIARYKEKLAQMRIQLADIEYLDQEHNRLVEVLSRMESQVETPDGQEKIETLLNVLDVLEEEIDWRIDQFDDQFDVDSSIDEE